MIDCNSDTVSSYTYDSFGNRFEAETYENPTVENPYQFAGYRWDQDAEMFYCNARWYNPEIYRFTGRDPVRGKYKEPLTLHAYLYCVNDPINNKDTNGKCFFTIAGFLAGSAIRLYLQGEDNARVGATVTVALSFIGVIMDYYLFWPKVQSVVDRFGGKQTQIPTEKGINKMDENEIIDKFIENQQKNSG